MPISIKAILRIERQRSDGSCPLRIRVTKDRKIKYFPTDFYLKPEHWDEAGQVITKKYGSSQRANNLLRNRITEISNNLYDLSLENSDFNLTRVSEKAEKITCKDGNNTSFFEFGWEWISQYDTEESYNTYRNYKAKLNKFKEFAGDSITFAQIDVAFLRRYRTHLQNFGNTANTIVTDLRKIRAIFNAAISEDIVDLSIYPFKKIKLKEHRAKKAFLIPDEIEIIKALPLQGNQVHARNLFLFSFFMFGGRVSDMVSLRVKDISSGHIVYRMDKTKEIMPVKIIPAAAEVIESYCKCDQEAYLFPFMRKTRAKTLRRAIANCTSLYNKLLRQIIDKTDINKHITSHVARHSWAQLADDNSVDRSIIQQALGHSDWKTTKSYLESMRASHLDNANESLFNKKTGQ